MIRGISLVTLARVSPPFDLFSFRLGPVGFSSGHVFVSGVVSGVGWFGGFASGRVEIQS